MMVYTKTLCNKILLVTLFLLQSVFCFSQQTDFSRIYFSQGEYYGLSLVQLNDSGYLIGGKYEISPDPTEYSFAMRINKYGDTIWFRNVRTYGGWIYTIIPLNDSIFLTSNGFIDYPNGLRFGIGKINIHGDTISHIEYGYATQGSSSLHMISTKDGGYLQNNFFANDYGFVKFDSLLNMQWHVSNYNIGASGADMYEDTDGGYITLGAGGDPQNYKLEKIDSAGNFVWYQRYGNQPAYNMGDTQGPRGLAILPDSNYLVAASGFDWQLMKIDRNTHDTIWTRNYDTVTINNVHINDYRMFRMIDAGNYTYFASYYNGYMLMDEHGDSLWCRSYPVTQGQNLVISNIIKTNDGGFAMVGSIIIDNGSQSIIFIKTDSIGNTVYTSVINPQYNFAPLSFYPNPATNEIFINAGSLATEKNVVFTLSDMQGRTVLQQVYQNNTAIDISVIPAGLYIATLRGKERELRGKVMVEK